MIRGWESREGLPLGAEEVGMGRCTGGLGWRVHRKDPRLCWKDAWALDRAGLLKTFLDRLDYAESLMLALPFIAPPPSH